MSEEESEQSSPPVAWWRQIIDWLWRIPLILAALAMLAAGALTSLGQAPSASMVATAGFAIGLAAVPLGILSLIVTGTPSTENTPNSEPPEPTSA